MDNRPIGVFDSGLGGLTVVKSMLQHLPQENIIYFGDTKRVPYGNRSKETLIEYVTDDILFLLNHDVKAIVIACNTADSMTMQEMKKRFNIPLVGVVEPAAAEAAAYTKNKRIGIIGTTATIESGAYGETLRRIDPDLSVFGLPCPLLVPLVEEGRTGPDDPVTSSVLEGYLSPFRGLQVDTLILGCTHYPLLKPIIKTILPDVKIISSGHASTNALREMLATHDIGNTSQDAGTIEFFVSDGADKFAKNGGTFIGREITGKVTKVDIGK